MPSRPEFLKLLTGANRFAVGTLGDADTAKEEIVDFKKQNYFDYETKAKLITELAPLTGSFVEAIPAIDMEKPIRELDIDIRTVRLPGYKEESPAIVYAIYQSNDWRVVTYMVETIEISVAINQVTGEWRWSRVNGDGKAIPVELGEISYRGVVSWTLPDQLPFMIDSYPMQREATVQHHRGLFVKSDLIGNTDVYVDAIYGIRGSNHRQEPFRGILTWSFLRANPGINVVRTARGWKVKGAPCQYYVNRIVALHVYYSPRDPRQEA